MNYENMSTSMAANISGKTLREQTQTEEMLDDVENLVKRITEKLEIVLSPEVSQPESLTNLRNVVHSRLYSVIVSLQELNDRINL